MIEIDILKDIPLLEANLKAGKITKQEFSNKLEHKLSILADGVRKVNSFTDQAKELIWTKLENL